MRGLSLKTVTFMFIVLSAMSSSSRAQVATGMPAFTSLGGGTFDRVNNGNLNVLFQIPVVSKAGRGLPFNYALAYNSSIWTPVGVSGSQAWTPSSNWGWGAATSAATGYITLTSYQDFCYSNGYKVYFWVYSNWTYVDPSGAGHYFPISVSGYSTAGCTVPGNYPPYQDTGLAPDGSGYSMTANAGPSATVYSAAGTSITPAISGENIYGPIVDTNGNQISIAVSNGTVTYMDTLGMTALTVTGSGTPSSPATYTYTGPSGSTNIQVTYENYNIKTAFSCSGPGISEYSASNVPLVNQINLPDGTHYAFTYEATPPGNTGYYTGRLASVTLPTGGVISYAYSGGSNGITCADGSAATVTRTTPDGVWTYNHSENGSAWKTTVTDPASNQTTYNFQANTNPVGVYETERQIGSLETVVTCYNGNNSNCNTTAVSLPISKTTATTTLGSAVSQTTSTYNGYGLPTEVDQSDFGSGAPGGLLRKTILTYAGPYPANFTNVEIEDGNSNVKSETGYSYNSYGNLTGQTLYNNGTAILSRTITPNSYGVVTAMTDYNSNSTSYGGFTCGNNTAFPTTITTGGLTSTLGWDCNGGVVNSVADPNTTSNPTQIKYSTASNPNNFWGRVVEVDYPDGGKTITTYNDTQGDFSIVTQQLVRSGVNHETTQLLDGLGRVYEAQDNSASTTVKTTYDELGRVGSVTNPYYSPSDLSYGVTSYSYDALNRLQGTSAITRPDGNVVGITYATNSSNLSYCTTRADEATKVRTTCADPLGRITSVTEDPSGKDYTTTYSYDPLGNLTQVAQGSSQTRTYAYDWLARLTSASTPESGTTTYAYPVTGAVCSGDPSAVCTRTDALGRTTTYAYDGLNRLTSKTYSDSTPPAYFSYDESSAGGYTLANTKGRLSHTAAGNGYTFTYHSYDVVGRPANYWECNAMYPNCSGGAWEMVQSYDLAGDITSYVTPFGITITQSITPAQQVSEITSSQNNSNDPPVLAQNMTYTAWGALNGLQNGCVGTGCTQVQEAWDYNNRLQPVRIQVGESGSPSALSCWVYNYYAGASNPTSCAVPSQATTGNNGNVMGYYYTDNFYSWLNHTATYGYDTVNRLNAAAATGSSTYNLTFNSDPYGNTTCVQNQQTNGLCPQFTFNTSTNQLSGYTYDGAGNMTSDAVHTYQWDAEGRLASVDSGSTATYAYDALGRRVQGNVQGDSEYFYVYDPAGDLMGGVLPSWGEDEMTEPVAGRMLVSYVNGRSVTAFKHINALGTWGLTTGQQGAVYKDELYYPWGQEWTGYAWNEPQWAGMQLRDSENGLDWTPTRRYNSLVGRWMTPDPAGLAAADPSDPQTWNMYAYVRNNPTSMTDPSGLDGCDPEDATCGGPCVPGIDPDCNPTPVCPPIIGCGPVPPGGGGSVGNGPPPVGVGGIGIWGGGMGSGPLSGDYGVGLPPLASGGGLPCDLGACGGMSVPGNAYQAEEVIAGYTIWEVIKDALFWGAFAAANSSSKRGAVTVVCKCQIIELGTGSGGAVGYTNGVGSGVDFASASRAAYASAVANAKGQMGSNSGFYLRHCQYQQQ